MSVVQSLIAWLGKSLRNLLHEFSPHIASVAGSSLYARDTFDIRRDAFLHPDMFVLHVREREVNHFVNQHPIIVELSLRDRLADDHASCRSAIAEGLACAHA